MTKNVPYRQQETVPQTRASAKESFERQQAQFKRPSQPTRVPDPVENSTPVIGSQPSVHAKGATERQCAIAHARGIVVTQEDLDFKGTCSNYGCYKNHSPRLCDLWELCMGCQGHDHVQENCPHTCERCHHAGHVKDYCESFAHGTPTAQAINKATVWADSARPLVPQVSVLGADRESYSDKAPPDPSSPRPRAINPSPSTHQPSGGINPVKGLAPPHLRLAKSPAIGVQKPVQKPETSPPRRRKHSDFVTAKVDQHGNPTGYEIDEGAPTLSNQWKNAVQDDDRMRTIKAYMTSCSRAFSFIANREGPYTFRDPRSHELTFDPNNGDWQRHVGARTQRGSAYQIHVSSIFAPQHRLDMNIDLVAADYIRFSFPPWEEAHRIWLREETGEPAPPSADLIDLSAPAPSSSIEPSNFPTSHEASSIDDILGDSQSQATESDDGTLVGTEALENLHIEEQPVPASAHEPTGDEDPSVRSPDVSLPE